MISKLTKPATLFIGAATLAVALASGAAVAQDSSIGYWKDSSGKVVRSGTNLCWRAGYWTPAMATAECDPDLAPKPAAPAAAPAPAAKPAAPAAAPAAKPAAPAPAAAPKPAAAPVTQKITLSSDVLFDFDKAIVKPEGKTKLDDLVGKLKAVNLEVIIAIGHTDSVGSNAYNQKLSVRRANAVKAYFVSKGIPANRIYTEGKGETSPIASNKTAEGRQKNRRVEIEVVGTRAK
jgi:OOP family OmpA-OmpF porin